MSKYWLFGGVSLLLLGAGCASTSLPAPTHQDTASAPVPQASVEVAPAVEAAVPPSVEPAPASNEAPVAETKVFNVKGKNFSYDPAEIRVKKGDKLKIVFEDEEGFHDLKVDGYNAATSRIQGGNTASLEFVADKAGTFAYYCTVGSHRDNGMEGKLIVE